MITIKNKNLKEYLEIILSKSIDNITEEDINSIKSVTIRGDMIEDDNYKIDTSDLKLFKNLDNITITDGLVTIFNMKDILEANPKSIILNRCAIDDDNTLSALEGIENLTLIKCFNENYKFLNRLNNLKSLSIVEPESEAEVDIGDIPKGIINIAIQRGIIDNEEKLKDLTSVEILNLLWTNLTDGIIDTVNQMPSLKELYVTDRHDCTSLRSDVTVYHDLIRFTFDTDDEPQKNK